MRLAQRLVHLTDIVGDNLRQHRRAFLLVAVLDGGLLRFVKGDAHATQRRGLSHHRFAHKVGNIDGILRGRGISPLLRHKVIHRRH